MPFQRDLSNPELVTLACYLEGGATRAVDTEDVAIRASSLSPRRFGWTKHPERVDLEAVRISLRDATRPINGGLIAGSIKSGWHLTSAGIELAASIVEQRPELVSNSSPILARERRQFAASVARESSGLRESVAFAKWSDGKSAEITLYDFFKATRTTEYMPPKEMSRRRKHLEALLAGDAVLARFVSFLFDNFSDKYRTETE